MKPIIYTFGYAGSTPQDLRAFVEALGAYLVDVRYKPYSRQSHWVGGAIREMFPPGIYSWVQSLGNVNYNNGGPIKLADPNLGKITVKALLGARPVILMCACPDPQRCHRKVAAEYLARELEADVVHLPARFEEWQGAGSEVGASAKLSLKIITLTQPWATLVAIGAKLVETRDWPTQYRGALAIHSSKTFPDWERKVTCSDEVFAETLREAGYRDPSELPLGSVLAVCRLRNCIRTEEIYLHIGERERAFGNFAAGRWGFVLSDVRRLPRPIPARGALGLWVPDEGLLRQIEEALYGATG